ncbi:dipeptidase [Streptomyces sp. NPDC002851]
MSKPVDSGVSAVRAYIESHRTAFLDDLAEWLRIPSVSAQPEHADDVRRSADWLAAKLSGTGFPTTEVWETAGAPAVFAEWPAAEPDAPTVLVYGHHDVQPAALADGWDTEPFEPVIRGNRLHARGAADDKGQVFFHTLGVRAHLAATGRTTPAVNLKLLIEGEEESGSPHFRALIEERQDRLTADAVIVSDTGMWSETTPSVCTGMRGLVECEIELRGPDQDIHSGSFGGAVPNPATAAARLVAALHDEHARVAIPGFYDGVIELTDRERALLAELPFDEEQWLRTAKSYAAHGEAGYSTLERLWARPTAEVNGIGGGYQGAGGKTIIPSSTVLKLSFRIVAGQHPEKIEQAVTAWVADQVPDGIRHRITFGGATRPCLTPLDHPALQAVARSMGRAFEQPVRFTREGGSGPAADLQDVLEAPVLFLGISVPSDGWHAPNEKVELDLLLKGVETAAYLWDDLSELSDPSDLSDLNERSDLSTLKDPRDLGDAAVGMGESG